ncbi:hypothetical protein VTO73DRAFT_7795 [Trametes versicolor]
MLQNLVSHSEATLARMGAVEEEVKRQGVELTELKEELTQLKSSTAADGAYTKGKGARILANDHKILKDNIHELAWNFLGLGDFRRDSEERFEKLAELQPLPDGSPFTVSEDGGKLYRPHFKLGPGQKANAAFIKGLVEQAYDNEERLRKGGQDTASWKTLPDTSFNRAVMTVVAQEYYNTLSRRWREQQTEEGKQKRGETNQKNNSRSKRATKTKNRRRMAYLIERMYGLEGAAMLCETDYASSRCTESSDHMSDDSKARRKAQGCGRGGKVIKALWEGLTPV